MTTKQSGRLLIGVFGVLIFVFSSQAGTKTWSTSATTKSWSLDTNWVEGTKPAEGDDVVIFSNSSAGTGATDPTDASGYANTTLNSLTMTNTAGYNPAFTIAANLKIGAGGIWNRMSGGSLYLSGTNTLTGEQTWGGSRHVMVAILKPDPYTLTWDGAGGGYLIFAADHSTNWTSGVVVRGYCMMNYGSAPGTVITPFGTGKLTLVNRYINGTGTFTALFLRSSGAASSQACILTNMIELAHESPSSGNFSIEQSQNDATSRRYILSGNITGTGAGSGARTLTFRAQNGIPDTLYFILTGNNTYEETTIIDNKTVLVIGNAGTSGTLGAGAVTVNSGGALAFNRSNEMTMTNVISGAGAVIQLGTGATTMTSANTFTGGTTVSNGTLWVNNISGSGTGTNRVNVLEGATLGGIGLITGAVSVASGAYLSPGTNSVGTLTVGSLAFSSNATFTAQVGGTGAGSYDQCVVTKGAIDITNASLAVSLANGYVPQAGDSFTIIRNIPGSAVTGRFTNDVDFRVAGVDGVFRVSYTGGAGHDIVLRYAGVRGTLICVM